MTSMSTNSTKSTMSAMSAMTSMSTNSTKSTMTAVISHLSNIAIMVIGVVVDMLDPAVGKIDRVVSFSGSCAIAMLLLIETGASVAISNGIVVVVRNYLIDFVSISMSSMSTSMTSMPKDMTSMTSMANRPNTRAYTMSSTEATKLGRGGGQEGRDANEDLHSVN